MKKISIRVSYITFLLLIALIMSNSNNCKSQTINSDRDIYERNNVLSCEVYKDLYKFGEPAKDSKLIKKTIYMHGFVYGEVFYTSGKMRRYNYSNSFMLDNIVVEYEDEWKHKQKETHEIKYNAYSYPVTELVYNKGGKLEYKIEYGYDSCGNMILNRIMENDGSYSKNEMYKYSYDSLGRIINKYNYTSNGGSSDSYNYTSGSIYIYGDNGQLLIVANTCSGSKEKFSKVEYLYEDNGLVLAKTYYNCDEEPQYRELFSYKYNE